MPLLFFRRPVITFAAVRYAFFFHMLFTLLRHPPNMPDAMPHYARYYVAITRAFHYIAGLITPERAPRQFTLIYILLLLPPYILRHFTLLAAICQLLIR